MKSYGAHESTRMKNDVWLTPPYILEALGQFDLDPCAVSEPRPWPTAKEHIALPQDGLLEPWHGRVWCNPPYGRKIYGFMEQMAEHNCGTALTFARTETRWFQQYVWPCASAILFLKGRLAFYDSDGLPADATAGAPACLIAYGIFDALQLDLCGLPGAYVELSNG